ncbi:hypothetical protein Tco_1253251 [Tanacetum coccineum]
MQCRTTGNVQRFNHEFEMSLVQQSGLVPAVKEPVVFDHTGEHVEITGTSSSVERKVTTPIEKEFEFQVSIEPHTEPAYSIENCGMPYRHCIPILTVFERFRNIPAAHVESDSISRLGVGKRLPSNMFSPHVPVDRPGPLSPVAKSISIDRNATMGVAPSEGHATKVFGRFTNACSNDFQSF